MSTPTTKTANGDQNGWVEYRRLVLAELERLSAAVAKTEANGSHLQMAMTQALSDAKQIILDKLRDSITKNDDETAKIVKDLVADFDRKTAVLEARFAHDLKEVKESLSRDEKKLDETHTELTALKAKAMMLGALSGFLVALISLVASIFIKK